MNYSEFVRSKLKPGAAIAAEMTPHKAVSLSLACLRLVEESDRMDAVKKYTIYNKDVYGISTHPFNTEAFKDFTISPDQAELLHAAIGLAGEAGELLDAVRKHVFDGQPLDTKNCVEELGDLLFFFEAMRQCFDWVTLDVLMVTNMNKLDERFKDGYSDKAAQERADKAGEE